MTTYDERLGAAKFENVNEGRSYPFADDAILNTEDGIRLPDDVLADMRLVAPAGSVASLSSVYISPRMISLCLAVGASALSCTVSRDLFEPYVPYRLGRLAGLEDTGGVVTFGQLEFPSEPRTYRFAPGVARLADCVMAEYVPAALRRFVDARSGRMLSGDVKLDFSGYVQAERTADGLQLKLPAEAARALLSDCDKKIQSNPCGATPVTKINGVAPDDKGRIVLWFH